MSEVTARRSWVRQAVALEYFSLVWMLAEGGASVWAGVAAHSLSLEVFGLDSLIELISAGVVLSWLRVETAAPSSERGEHAERRAAYVVAGGLRPLGPCIRPRWVPSLATP